MTTPKKGKQPADSYDFPLDFTGLTHEDGWVYVSRKHFQVVEGAPFYCAVRLYDVRLHNGREYHGLCPSGPRFYSAHVPEAMHGIPFADVAAVRLTRRPSPPSASPADPTPVNPSPPQYEPPFGILLDVFVGLGLLGAAALVAVLLATCGVL